jgi:hypothetical protein
VVRFSINDRRKYFAAVTPWQKKAAEPGETTAFHSSDAGSRIVQLIFLSSPFTLKGEPNRTIPGSKDVPSTEIEGDPYLAANRLPDEG